MVDPKDGLLYDRSERIDPLADCRVTVLNDWAKLILFIFNVLLSVKIPVWSQAAAKFAALCATLATRILFVPPADRSEIIMALGFVGADAVEVVASPERLAAETVFWSYEALLSERPFRSVAGSNQ